MAAPRSDGGTPWRRKVGGTFLETLERVAHLLEALEKVATT